MTSQTLFNPSELIAVLPEGILVILALILLVVDLTGGRNTSRRTLGIITACGMLVALIASFFVPQGSWGAMGGLLRNDTFAFAFRIIFLIGGGLSALLAVEFKPVRAGGEFFTLLTLATMAMGLMAASNDIIMLYLATETASIALYLLAGFMRDTPRSAESGLKYFVFGSVTSTIMLYGLSLLYGMSGGQTNYAELAKWLMSGKEGILSSLALLMVLVGFAFKTSAVPFQFWAPDVYQGAPSPVSGFISTASKAAGFAILIRFLQAVYPAFPVAAAGSDVWIRLMMPVTILTMFAGNLLAIMQTNVKRLLAYSSIAQAGYALMGVTAFAFASASGDQINRTDAIASVIFYVGTYMLTNILAFGVTGLVVQKVGSEDIRSFSGLSKRAPYLALAMVAALLSLAGAPPLVGFVGKLFLFRAALNNPALTGMVVAGVINVLISVYYYLGIVRSMYAESDAKLVRPVLVPQLSGLVVAGCALALVVTTLAATPLWNLAVDAAKSLLN